MTTTLPTLSEMKVQKMSTFKPVLVLAVLACATSSVLAQEAASSVDGVTQAQQVFEGRVVGSPYSIVRSGPSENYYPVANLKPGQTIIINGIKFDWLRIVPPDETFSLIAKQFVEINGSNGKIKGDNVNVRAGSSLNAQYATIQTRLMRGDVVTVLGEVETRDGVFVKIKPPPGAYVYIRKDLVEPVRPVAGNLPEPRTSASTTPPPIPQPTTRTTPTDTTPEVVTRPHTTRPEEPAAPRQPSQQELAAAAAQEAAEKAYDEADRAWREAMTKSLEEQPLDELLVKFEALANNENLPVTLRKQAISTVGFIRARAETKKELMAIKKSQDELAAKLAPLRQQNQELQNKFRQLDMTTYTAVGQLQTTTLQEAGYSLMRLVDPQTGYTLVYLRSADAALVGQFVGVKGEIVKDSSLKVQLIAPKTIVTVDPATVGNGITAEIMPQSMRPAGTTPAPAQP